jgi:hypothetical protein
MPDARSRAPARPADVNVVNMEIGLLDRVTARGEERR